MAKDHMLRVRVSDRDLAKLQQIATVTDGNLSDAIRLMIHAARVVVRPMRVIECVMIDEGEIDDTLDEYLSELNDAGQREAA